MVALMGTPRPKGSNAGFPGGLRDGMIPVSLNCQELITMSIRACLAFALLLTAGHAHAQAVSGEPAPISPLEGEVVASPVTVRFGLAGMGVAPAGTQKAGTGHHHLIIDAATPKADQPIPADEHHVHFGGGQTETTIVLAPGEHTLQLVVGDFKHVPHDKPVVSERITVRVE